MKVQFIEHVEKQEKGKPRRFKQERVEIANGDYRRVFERKDEPFEITPEEWPLLRRTGEFELFVEGKAGGEQKDGEQKNAE